MQQLGVRARTRAPHWEPHQAAERETRVGQQERTQRFAQAPGTREIFIGKRRRGRHEPVVGQPGSEVDRVLDLVSYGATSRGG
jgi:hypothetical protein